ncbi:MAG TPA: MBL fold metallo-hydrolase [Candidatus Eisenbacteria bacterium]|nr:MBL fold metallo-hydrolase [Candidatus Eisenbacteria bacterium]
MSGGAAAWSDLGDGIRVRRSAAFAMNSVLLLDPQHTVIVDPGVLPSELDDLAREVTAARPKATTLFFTHAHWDHVLGRPWWPRAKTIAHDRFAAEAKRDRDTILREAEAIATKHGERWEKGFTPFKPDQEVSGLHFMRLDPWRLVFRDAPGHSASQLSCHLPDRRLLIAADMLSDIEPPILNGPCAVYRKTLDALMNLAENDAIETIVPGHGSIARDGADCIVRLLADALYLTDLETRANLAADQGLSFEDAQESLAAMDYTGKRSKTYPTESFHRDNMRFAFDGVMAERR